MKKTIKLAVVAALALGATSAFATNGDVMIGQGAKSRAMGGVGIAKSFGAESGLANPAMIASVEKSEATLVVTAFAPSVAFKSSFGGTGTETYSDSAANFSVIPEIAYATSITDRVNLGLVIAGTAGMGTDYDEIDNAGHGTMRMKTELNLLKVAVPVSYKVGAFTAGVAGILQYGTLQLSHLYDSDANGTPESHLDNGASSDVGYGLEFGAAYEMENGLTLGAVYKSKIGMTYENTISSSVQWFGGAAATGVASGDNLDQPAEIGVGISYVMGANTISADYKNIAWADAAGYGDFGWENQDVYAVGYEYGAKSYAVRLGYNHAKNPIAEQTSGTNMSNSVKNFFNLAGFPGIIETHYTIGGGYSVSDALDLDASFIYAPETELSYNISGLGAGMTTADVTHSQMALTIAASYKF